MRVALKLAARGLRSGARDLRLMFLCLFLGVAAIAAISEIRAAVEGGMAREARALLGGDAEIRLSYRRALPEERSAMEARATSEVIDLRALVHVGDESALTELRAVDAAYPLVGQLLLDPPLSPQQAFADNGAVMAPVLADRLGLTVGETFALGTENFTLRALITRAPDDAGGEIGFGPRTITRLENLAASGLLTEGTLFTSRYRLDGPSESLEAKLQQLFPQSGMLWQSEADTPEGAGRFVERLGRFMVLIALSGLMVGGVGISAAISSYLAKRMPEIATLRALGASGATIWGSFALQIGAVTLAALLAGTLIGGGLPVWLAPELPVAAEFYLYPRPLLEAALYGALTSAIFTLLPLSRAAAAKGARLHREGSAAATTAPLAARICLLLLITLLICSATLFSGAALLALGTFAGIGLVMLLLWLIGALLETLARHLRPWANGPVLRLALGGLGAKGGETRASLLALGLGLTVLATIGQIERNLARAISDDLPTRAPSYFVLDIQPSQIGPFRTFLSEDADVTRFESSPMLRGIITALNGTPAADWPNRHWALEGDRGISMAQSPPEGTRITAGKWWSEESQTPEISFSAAEAEALGLGLGDTITLNILGREITAAITSLRRVNFQSAGMGFVLILNPAALAGAPYSNIATLYAPEAAEARLLREMAQRWPNITAIRVKDVIEAAARVMEGVGVAAKLSAAMVLLTGALVLIGTAAAGQAARRREAALLKAIGATRGQISASFALRAILTGAGAGIIALSAALLASAVVLREVMNLHFVIFWDNLALILLGGIATALIAQLLFLRGSLAKRPAEELRQKE